MRARPLEFHCPLCGSTAITYTCEPECCFHHVCGACGASFEPATQPTGECAGRFTPPGPPPDPCDPAAACAECGSLAVYLLEDGRAACARCGMILEITMREVKQR